MKNILFLIASLFTVFLSFGQNKGQAIYIDVFYSSAEKDTLSLEFQRNGWALTSLEKVIIEDPQASNHFEIYPKEEEKFFYLNLGGKKSYLLLKYLAEPGDSVQIYVQPEKLIFRGRGFEKYQCRYDMDKISATFPYPEIRSKNNTIDGNLILDSLYYSNFVPDAYSSINYNTSSTVCSEEVLKLYKSKLPEKTYYLLLANLRGKAENKIWHDITVMYNGFRMNADQNHKIAIRDSLTSIYLKKSYYDFSEIPDSLLAFSPDYLEFLSSFYLRKHDGLAATLAKSRGILSSKEADEEITENFNGLLRDRVITQYMLVGFPVLPNLSDRIDRVLSSVNNSNCRNLLISLKESNSAGSSTYNFAIPDIAGKIRTQKEFKGKLVLIDFWFTGCSGCLIMAENLKPIAEYFKNNKNVVFLSVSADRDISTWKKSVSKEIYTNKHSIDLFTEGRGFDHPMIKNYKIRAYPSLILIGKNGKIISTSVIKPYNESDRKMLIQLIEKNI